MTRSLKKNPFVAIHLLRKIDKLKTKEKKEIIKTWSRASTIIPAMIGHTIAIHNGKEYIPIYRWYGRSQIGRICTYFEFPKTYESR